MAFEKYWQRLNVKNPALAREDTKLTLTISQFKAAMQKAYAAGYEDRKSVEATVGKIKQTVNQIDKEFNNMFSR